MGPQPHKAFEFETDGECLTFIQNEIAIPNKIKIKGEYTVKIPFGFYDRFDKPRDFGDVFIHTELSLTELKFIYEGEESIKKIEPYLRIWADGCTGMEAVSKKDMVFSVKLTLPEYEFEIMDLLPKTCCLEDNLAVDFQYDYLITKV
jgi:hypothetical protein